MSDTSIHLAGLLVFTGRVGTAIRMYSAYNQGDHRNIKKHGPDDVMFLADTLTTFEFLGQHLVAGQADKAVSLCDSIITSYEKYLNPPAHFDGRGKPSFDRNPTVDLVEAIAHLKGLKAALAVGCQARHQ